MTGRTRVGIYDSGPAGVRESTWVHGRREWYRKLCVPATEVDELGARVAQSLWAEEESAAFNIRERFRDITKVKLLKLGPVIDRRGEQTE